MNTIPAAAAPAVCDQGRFLVRSTSRSHVGRIRVVNEDRILDDAASGVWAVFDGMGGHRGGDLAAQQGVDSLRQAISGPGHLAPHRVRDALAAANGLIQGRNQTLGVDAGATAVTATLIDGTLEIAWAGDSRAYRLGDARAEQLTRDHSVVQQLVEAGLLTPAMADAHPQANVITRALGVASVLELETISVEAGIGRFLLCSDGLSRSLRNDDIDPELTLAELADRLIANALQRDGTDNISLVLIEVAAARWSRGSKSCR